MLSPSEHAAVRFEANATETETDTDSRLRVIGAGTPLAQRVQRFVAVVATAATLCVAAVFCLSAASSGKAQRDAGEAVSLAGDAGEWKLFPKTGCGNWHHLYILLPKTGLTLGQCKRECLSHLQCSAINFQSGDGSTCSATEGCVGKGACYLFVGEATPELGGNGALHCKTEDNSCWDLLLRPGGSPLVLQKPQYRTSCANINAVDLGKSSKVESKYECMEKCRDTSGCAAFAHQPGKCGGGPGKDINWCVLLKAGCEPEHNTCNDLYNMEDLTPTTTAPAAGTTLAGSTQKLAADAKKGDTSISLADESGYNAGDSIEMTDGSNTQTNTVVSKGTLTLKDPLQFDFVASSTTVGITAQAPTTAAPTTPITTMDLGECEKGTVTCSTDWSDEKKQTCCDAQVFCCSATTKPNSVKDCTDANKPEVCSKWPDGHKKVCQMRGEACQAAETTTAATAGATTKAAGAATTAAAGGAASTAVAGGTTAVPTTTAAASGATTKAGGAATTAAGSAATTAAVGGAATTAAAAATTAAR